MGELIQSITEYSNFISSFNKVSSGGGAPGADHVTADKFALDLDKNIHLLIDEIKTSVYNPGPIAKFQHKAQFSEKVRTLGVPSVRDRIVQTAILNVLEPVFEKLFLRCSYGYRPRKSALQAVMKTEKFCKDTVVNFAFNADIHSFFDSIDTAFLLDKIKAVIKEKPLINLLAVIIKSSSESLSKGITLGAPTSPLFGNIYLNDFDKLIFKESNSRYLRYADDFAMFSESLENCRKLRDIAVNYLKKELMLTLSEEKSSLVKLNEKEGFDFLGYYFNKNGKYPSEKSLCSFSEKINGISAEGIKNIYIDSIIEGWLNYFDIKTTDKNNTSELLDTVGKLLKEKPELNIGLSLLKSALLAKSYQKDISSFIIKSIKDKILSETMAGSYSRDIQLDAAILSNELDLEKDSFDFISQDTDDADDAGRILKISDYFVEKGDYEKAVRLLNRFTEKRPEFTAGYEKLSYIYNKMGLAGLAEKMKEYVGVNIHDHDINDSLKIIDSALSSEELNAAGMCNKPEIDQNSGVLKLVAPKFLSLFTGSDNYYAIGAINQEGKVFYSKVDKPLDEEAVILHINGKSTAGEYIVRNDNCINFAVLDVDIASEYIKNISVDSDIYYDYLSEAFNYALFIKNTLKEKTGSECYIEFSGYKGYHVWFFFDKPVQAKSGRKFVNFLVNEHKFRPHINIEIFPKENKLNVSAAGSLIKLPLGINVYTGKETYFVNENGNKILNQFKFLIEDIKRIPESSINNILNRQNTSSGTLVSLNENEIGEFKILLDKCQVLKYLYDKAKITKYLTHTERLSILYSIGHTSDGKDMVNYFMSLCANYDQKITLKYINKVKGSKYAISCYKIREWLSYITSQVGCNCKFKLEKGEYPNILLHLKGSSILENNILEQELNRKEYVGEAAAVADYDKSGKSEAPVENIAGSVVQNDDINPVKKEEHIMNLVRGSLILIDEENKNDNQGGKTKKNKDMFDESVNDDEDDDAIDEIVMDFLKNRKELVVANESYNRSKEKMEGLFENLKSDKINTRYGVLRKIYEGSNIKFNMEI
ncbi:MAG: CRISPR-associated primase-polymerase type A1 [Deltaproteobacteria bacterium]|nr:CRISPR-associated primase-polymerase type A1 [Deltaproteobacteria bacterium]